MGMDSLHFDVTGAVPTPVGGGPITGVLVSADDELPTMGARA